jgi:hypothetical protein
VNPKVSVILCNENGQIRKNTCFFSGIGRDIFCANTTETDSGICFCLSDSSQLEETIISATERLVRRSGLRSPAKISITSKVQKRNGVSKRENPDKIMKKWGEVN